MRLLTFDLGGSSVKSGVVNERYEVTEKKKYILRGESHESKLEAGAVVLEGVNSAERFVDAIVRIKNSLPLPVDGIAFSYNCPTDQATGDTFVGGAAQRFLNNQNFPRLFAGKCDVPVAVAKDGNCQLLAEVAAGSLQGTRNALALGIGSGISCGILLNGEIFNGGHNYAGELSLMLSKGDTAERSLKNFALNSGIWGLFGRLSQATGVPLGELNGFTAFELIHSGDGRAVRAFEEYVRELSMEIYNLHCVLDPEAISIGGGIARETILIDRIRENVTELANRSQFSTKRVPEIRQNRFYNDANLIGAAVAFRRYARPCPAAV